MRHLPLTIALLVAAAPAWAQGSSFEKSLSSMQEAAERGSVEVSPPAAEAMQERAEKFVRDMVAKDAAIGDPPPKAEPSPKVEDRPASQAAAKPASSGNSSSSSSSGGSESSGALSLSSGAAPEKNTLGDTEPEKKADQPAETDGTLSTNRKSKSAGIRTGQTAARPVRKVPGFVELN